jgi:hypothetical protein
MTFEVCHYRSKKYETACDNLYSENKLQSFKLSHVRFRMFEDILKNNHCKTMFELM